MSFSDWKNAKYGNTSNKKKKKDEEKYASFSEWKNAKYGVTDDDIAPVKSQTTKISPVDKWKSYISQSDYGTYSKPTGSKRKDVGWKFWEDSGDDKYDFINNINNYRDTVGMTSAGTGQKEKYGNYTRYSYMTPEQVGNYNYIYAKYGKDKADEYLKDFEEEMNKSYGKDLADKTPGGGKGIVNILAKAEEAGNKVVEALTGDEHPTSQYQYQSQAIKENEEKRKAERANQTRETIYAKWKKLVDEKDYATHSQATGSKEKDTKYDFINNIDGYRDFVMMEDMSRVKGDRNFNMLEANDRKAKYQKYTFMSTEEIGMYNYLYAKHGKDKAEEYLAEIEEHLNKAEGEDWHKNATGTEKALWWFPAAVEGYVQDVKQFFSSDELPTSATEFGSQLVKQEAYDTNPLLGLLYDSGEMITRQVPSIAASVITGGFSSAAGFTDDAVKIISKIAGAIPTFISSAGGSYKDALSEGKDKGEARAYSTTVGALEATLQYALSGVEGMTGVGTDKLMSKVATMKNGLAKTLAKHGIRIGAEITEEELQLFLEPLVATVIFGEDYDAPAIEEMVKTAFVTAISTGAINTVSDIGDGGRVNGFTTEEARVVEKYYEDEVKKAEENGEKLTSKEKNKLREDIVERMNTGQLDTDTIEKVLGGKTYETYKSSTDKENALKHQLEELDNEINTILDKENPTIRDSERLTEARNELADVKNQLQGIDTKTIKSQLSDEVFGIVKNSRLAETYNDKAKKSQAFEADLTKYTGKQKEAVQRAIDSGVLNDSFKSHQLVDTLSRIEADKGIIFDYADNAKLKETGFAIEGKAVNGFVKDGTVTLNIQSSKAWQSTVGHEITHILEGTDAYTELRNALFEYAESKGELQSRRANLTELYKDMDADVEAELTADLVGDYLFTDKDFINKLSGNRNLFQKVYDEIKYLWNVATGKQKAEIEKVKEAFDEAWKGLNEKGVKETDGKTKLSIVALENGNVYVQASRKVINGSTVDEMRSDISKFFSDLLDGNSSLDIPTIEGDVLTITKAETADKARDNYKTVNGKRIKMTDEEFAVKMRVEAHIDEVAEVSKPTNKKSDSKDHPFAKDGFTYRKAYFEDFDGQYYEVTLSIGNNGTVATVYNVGKIKESALPSAKILAVVGSKPLGNTLSNNDIPQNAKDVNTKFSLSEDSQGNELGLAVQKRFANSKAVDENGNLKVLYHGTYNGEFYTFDKSKGSIEGDFGSGFYFTDNEYDVSDNYEGGGADFENKVTRRAEQIEAEEEIDYHEAEKRAREELYKGSFKHTVYVNIENPAIVGETNLLDPDKYFEEYDREDYDSDEDYEGDVEQLIADDIDQIIWDVDRNVDVYTTDGLAEVLWNAVNEGGIDIEQLKANINNLYLEDSNGNMVGNEVTRQIIESLGYDGIIDNTVSTKFNMNLEEGTTHYIVFKPNQIKSVDNQNPTDNPDIRHSISNEGEEFAPIGNFSTPLKDLAIVKEDTAPVNAATEDIAPVQGKNVPANDVSNLEDIPILPDEEMAEGTYETIKPKRESQPRLKKVINEAPMPDTFSPMTEEEANAIQDEKIKSDEKRRSKTTDRSKEKIIGESQVAYDKKKVKKDKGKTLSTAIRNFVDKGAVFENWALKHKDRALMDKYKVMARSESKAQYFMENGKGDVKGLKTIRDQVVKAGLEKEFDLYMKHRHNVHRMKYDLPVFGYDVTSEMSQQQATTLENQHPEFKEWAKEIYKNNNYLRQMMVNAGIITQETANRWAKKYPEYVPLERLTDDSTVVDDNGVGISAPLKWATGGNQEMETLFKTMAHRTEQIFKAIDKNNFGLELKNALGGTVENSKITPEELFDNMTATDEGLLQEGKDGKNPTFTVIENGERVTFEITEEMYEALKPTSDGLAYTNKVLNTASNLHKKVLTEYNLFFAARNAIKDSQDVLINSQHPVKTYANMPQAFGELLLGKGEYLQEYWENGGKSNTYFDKAQNTFADKGTFKKVLGFPIEGISKVNDFVEAVPRLAEYIASRKKGATIDAAMLDAARVTTDFSAGGDVTKFLNRNGATFLNASVQGAAQQVRNIREAKANGLKGILKLSAKYASAGLPALLFNALMWDDDDEYEELSDYVKDNYYIVGKYGDGNFVRIPKGRMVSVIQEAFEQVENFASGDETDFANVFKLAVSNIAPNNPVDNHVAAPIAQVATNKTWYGEDLVPTRLQDVPASEQYDETIDSISKWLGEKTGTSPYKINYLLDQYTGFIGDMLLPALTPEAERGDVSGFGNMIAPVLDQFTVDGTMKNQNVGDFYDTVDKLKVNANSMNATDEDILKSKYMGSISSEIGRLYGQKREIQNGHYSDAVKYRKVREIQQQINSLAKESINTYNDVYIDGNYATVGDKHFEYSDGEWKKINEEKVEKTTPFAKALNGYSNYLSYSDDLNEIHADKDEFGKSINGSRKAKVLDYINNLDADYYTKIILYKSEYPSDDTYNMEIIDYLNSREDLTYDDMVSILTYLDFTVDAEGNIYWN